MNGSSIKQSLVLALGVALLVPTTAQAGEGFTTPAKRSAQLREEAGRMGSGHRVTATAAATATRRPSPQFVTYDFGYGWRYKMSNATHQLVIQEEYLREKIPGALQAGMEARFNHFVAMDADSHIGADGYRVITNQEARQALHSSEVRYKLEVLGLNIPASQRAPLGQASVPAGVSPNYELLVGRTSEADEDAAAAKPTPVIPRPVFVPAPLASAPAPASAPTTSTAKTPAKRKAVTRATPTTPVAVSVRATPAPAARATVTRAPATPKRTASVSTPKPLSAAATRKPTASSSSGARPTARVAKPRSATPSKVVRPTPRPASVNVRPATRTSDAARANATAMAKGTLAPRYKAAARPGVARPAPAASSKSSLPSVRSASRSAARKAGQQRVRPVPKPAAVRTVSAEDKAKRLGIDPTPPAAYRSKHPERDKVGPVFHTDEGDLSTLRSNSRLRSTGS